MEPSTEPFNPVPGQAGSLPMPYYIEGEDREKSGRQRCGQRRNSQNGRPATVRGQQLFLPDPELDQTVLCRKRGER